MIALAAELAICRTLCFTTAMFLFGTGFFVNVFASNALGKTIVWRLHFWIAGSVLMAVLANLASVPVAVAAAAETWHEAMQPGIATAFLWETAAGHVLILRSGLALMLAAVFYGARDHLIGVTILSALLLASFAFSGHAVMDDGVRGFAHRGNDIVHVLAGALWLGSLAPLLPCLATLREPKLRTESHAALRRFSIAGHGVVAVVLLTGIINALFTIGRPAAWLALSPYHILLIVKAALVASMVGLELSN